MKTYLFTLQGILKKTNTHIYLNIFVDLPILNKETISRVMDQVKLENPRINEDLIILNILKLDT